jgi:hypothetical protein
MTPPPAETFQTPPIIFIYAMLSAVSIILAMLRWIWMMRNEDPETGTMRYQVILAQIYVFIAITILSLVLTIYIFFLPKDLDSQITIIPELIILSGAGYFFAKHLKRSGYPVIKGLIRELGYVAAWVLLCVLSWAVTIGAGFVIYEIVTFFSRNERDFIPFAIFSTGFLWIAPPIILRNYVLKRYEKAMTLFRVKIADLLLISAFAFLILMAPLAMQEAANSPELLKAKYEKPLRRL